MAGLLLRRHIAVDHRYDAARHSTITGVPIRRQERDQVRFPRAAGDRNEPALDLHVLISTSGQSCY